MAGDKIVPYRRFLERRRQWRSSPGRDRLRHWIDDYRRLWGMSLDRLRDHLVVLKEKRMRDLRIEAPAGEPIIIMTRSFDAPRALLWKALSEPAHVVRWFGPHGHKNRVIAFDFRIDGRWEIETTTGDGQVINFNGEFREIEAPWKLTQTFRFGDMPMELFSLDATTLEELPGGRTLYRTRSTLPDLASRDGMLASGMEVGVVEGFERLDAMLEEFKSNA